MISIANQRRRLGSAVLVFSFLALGFIPDAHARKGRVRIESNPPNAAIYVDDKTGGIKGYTPANLRINTGTRKIILEKEGYKTTEQFVQVKMRKKTTLIEMEKIPETAKLHFIADPNIGDAKVTVDGEDKGTLKDDLEIPSGRHLVEITKEGYQKWERWFELQQAEKRDVDVKLEQDLGDVKVVAQPSVKDAFVYINDENKGAAPWAGQLPPGKYKIDIKAPGFTCAPQTILVETGQKAEVTLQMVDDSEKEKIGELAVASEPAVEEGLVFIDGLNKGPAPWNGMIESGHHKIEVRAPNYACDPDTIFVKGNQQNVVTIKLYPIAKLNASVNVDKAEVFIDESSIGFTPLEDVDIPAMRSTLYIRKEGYKEYSEVIFPQKGEVVNVNTTLEYAPKAGMKNYFTLKYAVGLWGPSRLTSDAISNEESTTYGPGEAKMSAALGYTHLFNPYIGLGLHVGFTFFGLGGDLALHADPMLRFQVPFEKKGRRLLELYLGLGAGFTGHFNKGELEDDLYEPGRADEVALVRDADGRTGASLGWNVMTPLGLQINVADFFGILLEAHWSMHKTYGKLDNPDPNTADKFEFMWMEVGAAAGIAIIF